MTPLLTRAAAALAGALLLAPVLPTSTAAAAPPAPESARVLLQLDTAFTPPGLLTAAARSSQADRLAGIRARVVARTQAAGAKTLRTYDGLPVVAVEATAAALRKIAATDVAEILPDEQHSVSLASSGSHIGAPNAWAAGATGTGQTVAVLDTGVETSHSFLTNKVVAEACFATSGTCPNGATSQIGPGSAAPCTYDDTACPHGTHVAGIVAGVGSSSAGIARGADVIAVQIFSRTTNNCIAGAAQCATGWTSDLLAGLDHVAGLARTRSVAAVNLSLGGTLYSGACDSNQPALKRAIDSLRSLGVATIASTGNEGSATTISSPGCVSTAVAVGSTSLGDAVSSFSNSSPQLTLLAPGERILSSYTQGRTAWMTGTSQAAPHVAGAVAVLRSAKPAATVDQVVSALRTTGLPVTDTRNARVTPRIRVDAALVALTAATTVTPVIEPVVTPVLPPAPAPTVPAPTTSPSPSPSPTPEPEPTTEPTPEPEPEPEPTDEPSDEPVSTRLSGDDRYSTAAAVFSAGFGCDEGGASSAVLARGDAFADALAGSYLSGAKDTGVLLTGTTSVPAATLAALKGSGARSVYLLGGTSAISDAVAAQLRATPSYDCSGTRGANLTVTRVSGANRFDTARRTAEHAGAGAVGTADLTGRPLRTAIVASGLGFADALAAGPLSYRGSGDGGFPTLLTSPGALSPEAAAALDALDIEQVVIPGGTAVVSPAVEAALRTRGISVVRLAGSGRTETAAAIARFAVDELGFPTRGVALARGDAFADALAGAAYAGDRGLPMLLTAGPASLGGATSDYLSGDDGSISEVTAFGGSGAISAGTLTDALRSLSL